MGEVSSLCDNGIPMESYSMKELISRPGAKYTEVICPASAMVYRPSLFKKTFYNKKYLLSVVLTTFIFFGLGTAVYAETAPTVQGGVIDLRNWNLIPAVRFFSPAITVFFGTNSWKIGKIPPNIWRYHLLGQIENRGKENLILQTAMRHIP